MINPNMNRLHDSWIFFGFVWICFMSVTLWPFISNEYPGLADYANHLARLHLLTGHAHSGWEEYYSVHHSIVPNLALDVVAGFLVECGLSPEVALRVFAAAANLLVVLGITYISSRVNDRRPPFLALWGFPIAFNRYYIWGFLNYQFAIGLGLFVFGLWVYGRRRRAGALSCLDQAFVSLSLILILICHLMGYAVTMLCMGLHTLSQMLRAETMSQGKIRCAAQAGLVILPSVLVYIFVCDHSASEYPTVYQDVAYSKMCGLASPFFTYHLWLVPLLGVAFLLSVFVAISSGAKSLKDRIRQAYSWSAWIVITGLLVAFLLAPAAMMNSYFLDRRLFAPVSFIALALIACRLSFTRAMAIISLAFICHLSGVITVNDVWETQSKSMREIRLAFEQIEVGSKVAGLSISDTNQMPLPPLQHAVTMAVYTRAAFVPTMFAKPINAESVAFNPPYDQYARTQGTFVHGISPKFMANMIDWARHYDYVLVTYADQVPGAPDGMSLITTGEHFMLFKVDQQ